MIDGYYWLRLSGSHPKEIVAIVDGRILFVGNPQRIALKNLPAIFPDAAFVPEPIYEPRGHQFKLRGNAAMETTR